MLKRIKVFLVALMFALPVGAQDRPSSPAAPSASPQTIQSPPLRSRSLPELKLMPATLADLKARIDEIVRQPAL
jgi:hypothetical protein